jgi:hypothetical protein
MLSILADALLLVTRQPLAHPQNKRPLNPDLAALRAEPRPLSRIPVR